MNIEIKCKGSSEAALEELHNFQGDLKELSNDNYEKLKDQFFDLGFSAPFFVWSHQGGERKDRLDLLDGHQRKETLQRMKKEGLVLPEKFPVVEIDAKSRKEAKRKLLAITSNYGKITKSGISEFLEDAGIDLEEAAESFSFDSIDFDDLNNARFSETEEEEKEEKEVAFTVSYKIEVDCNTELTQRDLTEELDGRGFKVRVLI